MYRSRACTQLIPRLFRTGKCDSCIGLLENIKHLEQLLEHENIKDDNILVKGEEEPDTSGLIDDEDNHVDDGDAWIEPSEKPLIIQFTKKVELDEKLKQSKIKSESEEGMKICEICTKEYSNRKLHMKNHHPVTTRCELCNKKYRNRKLHMKNHHFDQYIEEFLDKDKKVYYCSEEGCDMKFLSEAKLLSHAIKVHNEPETIKQFLNKSKCPFCDEIFEKESWSLMRHVKVLHFTEADTEAYKEFMQSYTQKLCPNCGSSFSNDKTFKNHLRNCNGPEVLVECHICGKSMKNSSLKTHIRRLHTVDKETCVCPFCGKFYKNRLQMEDHSKFCETAGREKFECPQCGKTFDRLTKLARHVKFTHHNTRNHECDKCGKRFRAAHDLEEHIVAIHEKLKPFICDLCGFKTAKHGNLNIHRQKSHNKPHLALTLMWQMIQKGEHPYIDHSYEFLHLIKPKNSDKI